MYHFDKCMYILAKYGQICTYLTNVYHFNKYVPIYKYVRIYKYVCILQICTYLQVRTYLQVCTYLPNMYLFVF